MSKLFFIVGLGTVLVVSLVLCATQPALTHPALAAADLPIYTDALAGGWQDWSWDTTRSFDNAQPVHSGSASIAITYTAAWAGFYLTGTALPASDYTAIRFWVHGGSTGGQSVNFHLDDGDSYPFTVQANTWLSVTVPFAALGNPTTLSALVWQDGSGNSLGQPTFYLDDISLIAPTPLTGVNLSGRTEGVTQIGYPFMATVDPMTTILPITYTWQSDGQTPVIHTGDNLTDTVTFTWTVPGPKVITVTANNELGTVTSTHLITLVAADLPIYTDTLAGGWQDWSWDTTRSFDNAQPVHRGSASIAITYTAAWAGFYLTGTALPASDYTAIRFWVHGGSTGGQSVNFHLDAGDSYPFTVQANTWLSVTIPFAALGNPITLSALIWQDNSGSGLGRPTFYLDDISLVGRPPDIGWRRIYLPLCAKNYCPGQFFDDFTNPNSGWGAWENSDYKFGGLNGEFQIILKNTNSGFWDTPGLVLPSDYVMEVDARHATTNLGNYSLMFGARIIDNDPVEFYRFVVYPGSQEYFMGKYNHGTWTTLIDWTYDGRINYGMAMNHLMVKRVGTSISVGVNSWLNTVYDGEFTSAGRDGGLEVFSHASAPTDMRFDNFRVSCPQ